MDIEKIKEDFLKEIENIKKVEQLRKEIENSQKFDKNEDYKTAVEDFEQTSKKWIENFVNFQKKITEITFINIIEDSEDVQNGKNSQKLEEELKNAKDEIKEKDIKIEKLNKRIQELENIINNKSKEITKEDLAATVIQKYWRRKTILKKWKWIVVNFCTSKEAKKLGERNKIIKEILQTERTYVKALTDLKNMYLLPLKKMLSDDEKFPITLIDLERMFMNVEQLQMIHYVLLQELEKKVESWPKIYLGETFFNSVRIYHLMISVNFFQCMNHL